MPQGSRDQQKSLRPAPLAVGPTRPLPGGPIGPSGGATWLACLGRLAAPALSLALLIPVARAGERPPPPATGIGPGVAPAATSCPVALSVEPLLRERGEGPLTRPPLPPPEAPGDYRHRLATTALGWPRLDRWCVWLEPIGSGAPSNPFEQRWLQAVEGALAQWQEQLPIIRVEDPAAAQVRLWRRRPPLIRDGGGRQRASHGRALLALVRANRGDQERLEPAVEVLVSPGQRQQGIQATALHELGHAFGLWGHSDHPSDAMAAVPGADPVLRLSARDLATLRWLYGQPTAFGSAAARP